MADPTRLRILRLLLQQDLCVCELMFILKMEQSRISHQLRILRDAGLVEDKREGRWITYRVLDETRPNLELLLNRLLEKQFKESEEVFNDLDNLELCLRQDVRRRHASSNQLGVEKT
ncbi:MAG: ArsR family transcriptional regulator [Candidatus Aminicenantes bacterium]|nr:ArsR family transcriptional regulator [Candidatus Aminicenantes bacterium]